MYTLFFGRLFYDFVHRRYAKKKKKKNRRRENRIRKGKKIGEKPVFSLCFDQLFLFFSSSSTSLTQPENWAGLRLVALG